MKKIALAALLLTLVGCDKQTEFGECIGIMDQKDTELRYDYSTNNIVVAVVLSETLIVPLVVVLDSFYCPVGRKAAP